MKKLASVVLALVLALALAGCCPLLAPDGTTTKSFSNCFKTAQDKVCKAPADVLAIADIVINLLKPEAAILIPGSAPYISLLTAQAIKDTGCAALTGLNTMIAFIQGASGPTSIETKGTKAIELHFEVDVRPLIDWRNSVK